MSEPETHDFMAVESFSQLPFIRSSPPQNNSSSSSSSSPASAIRLFGINVPQENSSSSSSNNNNNSPQEKSITATASATAVDPIRKFECHYCCRNFPTSQALGGHQNAHKRERQHAKRAHLQSTIAAHHYQYRLPPTPPTHLHYYSNNSSSSSISTSAAPPRLGLGSISQPINGNPLPGLWRVPHALIHRDRALQMPPLFRGEPAVSPNFTSLSAPPPPSSSSSSSIVNMPTNTSNRLVYDKRKENVSLDLHL